MPAGLSNSFAVSLGSPYDPALGGDRLLCTTRAILQLLEPEAAAVSSSLLATTACLELAACPMATLAMLSSYEGAACTLYTACHV